MYLKGRSITYLTNILFEFLPSCIYFKLFFKKSLKFNQFRPVEKFHKSRFYYQSQSRSNIENDQKQAAFYVKKNIPRLTTESITA